MKGYKLAWALAALVLLSGWTTVRSEGSAAATVDDDDEYEDVLRAQLVVRKSVADELVVQGRNVTVTIDIFNSGSASAKSVVVKDVLPEGATLLEGSLDAKFPIIADGSSAKYTYTMVFSAGGSGLALPVATVTYQAEEGSKQEGQSSTMGVFVMTPVQQITRYALIAGTYVSLGVARTPTDWRNMAIVAGLAGAVVGGNFLMKSFTSASVSRKRQRALQELEKNE